MAEELGNKVAIVTGGNTGIGAAVVLALAEKGAKVVIDYVTNPDAEEELERKIASLGETAVGVQADVSKVADLQKLIDAAVSNFGRLDVMVNNAGIETRSSILDTSEEQYEKVLAINLKSAFFGTQLAAKQMISQGTGGRIINMTSVHEDWPMPGNTPYCLSKGGMRMLTRTAGVELATYGITVTGVGPSRYHGDESNQNPELPGYARVDLYASLAVGEHVELAVAVSNLLDAHYASYGLYGDPTGVGAPGVPPADSSHDPSVDTRFQSPAAPAAWRLTLRVRL